MNIDQLTGKGYVSTVDESHLVAECQAYIQQPNQVFLSDVEQRFFLIVAPPYLEFHTGNVPYF